jgi:hypothetical protein
MKVKKSKLDNKRKQAVTMERGGLHTDPTEPTRADSLDLYNNALLVKDYYMDRGTYKWNYIYDVTDPANLIFDGVREALERKYGDPDKILDKIPYTHFNRALTELSKKYGSMADIPIDERKEASLRGRDIYESIDPYRFKRREVQDVVIDDNAPMQLFDTRITPTQVLKGENIKKGDIMYGDVVNFYAYDPIAIAPIDQLTPEQIKERVDKYGNSGVPARYQDPNKPGYGGQSSQSSPTTTQSSNITTPSRPRIEIDKMPPLDFSIDLPTTLQPIERPEGDRLIDTQDIYRTLLSNRNNVRGDEQSLDQVGERRVYERPDGTRYTAVDRFSPEMIRQLRRLQRERERGTVTF